MHAYVTNMNENTERDKSTPKTIGQTGHDGRSDTSDSRDGDDAEGCAGERSPSDGSTAPTGKVLTDGGVLVVTGP